MLLMFFQTLWYFCIVLAAMVTIGFFIGSCWLFVSFAKDITSDLDLLNIAGKSNRSRLKIRERFCNIVQVHSNVKELSVKLLISFNTFLNCWNLFFLWFQTNLDVLTILTPFMSLKSLVHSFGQLFQYPARWWCYWCN